MQHSDRFPPGAEFPGSLESIVPHGEPFVPPVSRPPIQVHVVAPSLVCWGLQLLVQAAGPRFRLVGSSATLEDAMSLQDWMQPEVLVLDMDDGYVVDEIARACANLRAKVLVLTTNGERGFVHRLMLAGVRGVLQKREPPSALLHAIEAVGRGHVSVPQAGGGKASMLRPPPARPAQDELGRMGLLTERERETIAALVTDVSAPAKVIAAQLRMSEHTLRNHLTSIYSKLGVSGRVALYALAKERHLIRRVTAWGDSEQ